MQFVIDIHQIMLISLFLTPFHHFHFHGSGRLISCYDLRLCHNFSVYTVLFSTALKYIFDKKIPAEFPDFSWRWSRSTGGTLWLLQTASSFVSDDDYDFDDNDSWYPIHCVKVCGKIFIELSSSPRHLALLTQPNHKP